MSISKPGDLPLRTESSFDAYMWRTLETKARFIQQVMSGHGGSLKPLRDLLLEEGDECGRRCPSCGPNGLVNMGGRL